jgi:hypothetical protein
VRDAQFSQRRKPERHQDAARLRFIGLADDDVTVDDGLGSQTRDGCTSYMFDRNDRDPAAAIATAYSFRSISKRSGQAGSYSTTVITGPLYGWAQTCPLRARSGSWLGYLTVTCGHRRMSADLCTNRSGHGCPRPPKQ